jgi:hypothetical protein
VRSFVLSAVQVSLPHVLHEGTAWLPNSCSLSFLFISIFSLFWLSHAQGLFGGRVNFQTKLRRPSAFQLRVFQAEVHRGLRYFGAEYGCCVTLIFPFVLLLCSF